MKSKRFRRLLEKYKAAPIEFQATSYWETYEERIIETIDTMDINQLRSGIYPILSTFGFNDVVHLYHPNMSFWKTLILKFIHKYIIKDRPILPYGININNIQEMAFHHCELVAKLSHSTMPNEIEVSTYGNPQDLFRIKDHSYTMAFLSYYIRYCFANKYMILTGNETIVELGSGSGYQIEVLKKIHPNLTILCFDLPAQLFLCQEYLSNAIEHNIVGSDETENWNDLSGIKKGSVHFMGNWQIPLLKKFKFDIFWNAASFGEMEPNIVENYLSYIKGNAKWIYLLQARNGKETGGKNRVENPIDFELYDKLLSGYSLHKDQDAWLANSKLSQSGGYFEGIWKEE